MADLLDELREQARICANEIARTQPSGSEVAFQADSRAKRFAGIHCPTCWVKYDRAVPLEIRESEHGTKFFICKHCESSGVF
ncbi:MAG TPA: hypothetical protein VHB01_05180 [Nitrosospira sp.]|nr:hypothetical protein [Nitrosospira sp.]